MTIGGWITFSLSVGAFTALFIWCIYMVITAKKNPDDKMVGFSDINSEMDMKIEREDTRVR